MSYAKVSKADPIGNYNFRVSIISTKLGSIQCGFSSVTGIGVTSNFKEYREGGNNSIPDKLLDTISASPVTFSKGMTENEAITDLVALYYNPTDGIVGSFSKRVDILVEIMNRTNTAPLKSYTLIECSIETFILGDLNSMVSEYMIEGFSVQYNALKKNL